MAETDGDLIEGRTCDGCTLCCKVLAIDELDKPRGVWCSNCNPRTGCRIYAERPAPCRSFYCGYRRIPGLDERWKPSHAKFLINYESELKRTVIHVDPARPGAWRLEPYLSTLRRWAAAAAREDGMVLVWTGGELSVVLPDRVKDLGRVADDDRLVPSRREIGGRVIWDVAVEKRAP